MNLKNIDFNPGKVVYNEFHIDSAASLKEQIAYLDEDLIQVEYPKNYVLDVGWYHGINGRFVVRVIKDHDWDNPVLRKETRNFDRLEKFIQYSVRYITDLIENPNKEIKNSTVPDNFDRDKFVSFFDEENILDAENGAYFYSIALHGFEFDFYVLVVEQFIAIKLRHGLSRAILFDVGFEQINYLDLSESNDLDFVSLNLYKDKAHFLRIMIKPMPSLELCV